MQKYRHPTALQIIEEVPDKEDVELEKNNYSIDFLLGLVQQLPDRYRLVFNLYVLDGYSHKEIAKLLKIKEGTSKSNLSRARSLLKNKIEIHQQKESISDGR